MTSDFSSMSPARPGGGFGIRHRSQPRRSAGCRLARSLAPGVIALAAWMPAAMGQAINIDNVASTTGPLFPEYIYTQNGYNPFGPFAYGNFLFDVKAGTGPGATLVGGHYMGFCVTPFLSDPADDYWLDVDTNGTALGYSVNGSADYWNIHTSLKYGAFKDVLATYASALVNTPRNSQAYADLVTAFSILSCELVLDYDGTPGSLNPAGGASTITDASGNAPAGSVAANYQGMVAAIGLGAGSGFELYAGAWPDPNPGAGAQDLVFFDMTAVPEPSAALLLLTVPACLGGRRRR